MPLSFNLFLSWFWILLLGIELYLVFSILDLHPMKKEKKSHKGRSNGHQNSTPAAPGSTAVHTTHQSPVNRTRTKLPTKRKQIRQEANGTHPIVDEYEIVVEMPRNQYRPAARGAYRGRGRGGLGLGHASRGHPGRGTVSKSDDD